MLLLRKLLLILKQIKVFLLNLNLLIFLIIYLLKSDGILELAFKVVPTPFSVNDDDKVKVVEKNYQLNDFNENVITYKKKTYAKDKYTNVTDIVFDLMVKMYSSSKICFDIYYT